MWFIRRSKHEVNEQELNAYVDGQLAPDGLARLEEHLPSCAACRGTLDELRSLRSVLRSLPRASAPRSFALRATDVEPAVAARPLGLLGPATPILGGLTAAAVVTFAVLLGVDVSDRGFGGAADDAASQRAVSEAAGDAEEGESSAELAAIPTGLNPSALPPDETNQSIDQGDPVTESSVGMTSAGDIRKAVDEDSAASEGGAAATPCAPGALCDELSITGDSSETNNLEGSEEGGGLRVEGGEGDVSLTPCPPTALCVNGEFADDLPQLYPAVPFSISTVDEEVGYDEQAALPYGNVDARDEFQSLGDAGGVAAAPVSAQADDGGYTRIRSAETALASLAIVGAALLTLAWWRRRAEERR